MSETSMFEKISKKEKVEKFSDNKGSDASEHAKKLAKEKSIKKPSGEEYYTVREGKVLKVIMKFNGAYTSYHTSTKALGPEGLKAFIKKCGDKWIGEYDYQDKCSEIIAKLQKDIKTNSQGKVKA